MFSDNARLAQDDCSTATAAGMATCLREHFEVATAYPVPCFIFWALSLLSTWCLDLKYHCKFKKEDKTLDDRSHLVIRYKEFEYKETLIGRMFPTQTRLCPTVKNKQTKTNT